MTKFEWQASDSAPLKFPMEIIAGSLQYQDGSGSLYVPGGSWIANGWGEGISSHVVGDDKKPLPNRLDIVFFSYTENQFYRGHFDLTYDKILTLFQEEYYSPKSRKPVRFRKIVVGVAPGGVVAAWVQGIDRSVEVLYGKAEKVDLPWSTLTSATQITREEYVQKAVKYYLETPEAVAALHKNGVPFGLWDRYRTRYDWQPLFTNMPLRDNLIELIDYYNGENEYLYYPLDNKNATSTRPIPKEMRFVWKSPTMAKGRVIKLYFNEAEIFHAFQTLGANHQPLKLEMRIETVNGQPMFTVSLRNEKEKIEFDHTEVKNYGT